MEIGLPFYKNKINEKSLLQAKELVKNNRFYKNISSIRNMIFLYSPRTFEKFRKIKNRFICKNKPGFSLLIDKCNDKNGILSINGIGAPNHCAILEDFIANGIKNAVIVGTAGGVSENLKIGDTVICTGAYKDEGTSYHYDNINRKSLPDYYLMNSLLEKFPDSISGDSWTTDAPYRETSGEIEYFRSKNVLTVEMEASAHFTVSKYRNISSACYFAISDVFTCDSKWIPGMSEKRIFDSLFKGTEQILEIFS